jgi:hypothetical protein
LVPIWPLEPVIITRIVTLPLIEKLRKWHGLSVADTPSPPTESVTINGQTVGTGTTGIIFSKTVPVKYG